VQKNKYAILIGINAYHESLGGLKCCVQDCHRLAGVLAQGDDGIPSENILLLTDDRSGDKCPTFTNIHSWLESWLTRPTEDDTVLTFFAGHGRTMDGKCYLVPCDATLQTIHVTGIPVSYVQELLSRCKARQKLLIMDACHSGAGRDVAVMTSAMLDQLAGGKAIYTISSCDAEEVSHEWEDKQQGVFSYYLAEALSGGCEPDAKGRVTADSIYEYVYDKVRAWAAQKRCTQSPKRFYEGTGVVVLRQAEPDWRAIALRLQERLDQSEAEVQTLRTDNERRPSREETLTAKGHEDVDFEPQYVSGDAFGGLVTSKYAKQMNEVSEALAKKVRKGVIEIPVGEWNPDYTARAEWVNGALVRAFLERGFTVVEAEGEAVVEVKHILYDYVGTLEGCEIAVHAGSQVLWKGKILLPYSEI